MLAASAIDVDGGGGLGKGAKGHSREKRAPQIGFRRAWIEDHNKGMARGRDLNPRYPLRYVRFRGGSFQPLTHLSGIRGQLPQQRSANWRLILFFRADGRTTA